MSLDLKFLYNLPEEKRTFTAEQVQELSSQVNSILRENRRIGELSDDDVLFGNKFLLSLVVFSRIDENLELDILPSDIEYMLQEINYLQMGYLRN